MAQNKIMTVVGWLLTLLVCAALSFSAYMKFTQPKEVTTEMAKFGYPLELLTPIGAVEAVCTVLYLIPQTAILGAVLLTGYLGGATSTHVRVHDSFSGPIILGVLVWLALFLRDPRVRALLPVRWPAAGPR